MATYNIEELSMPSRAHHVSGEIEFDGTDWGKALEGHGTGRSCEKCHCNLCSSVEVDMFYTMFQSGTGHNTLYP